MKLSKIVGCIFLVSTVSMGYSHDSFSADTIKVDAGGYKLRMVTAGEGSPTVVFESGRGVGLETWSKVFPQIAAVTKAVVYDRAGIGESEVGPLPRTAEQISKELHLALRNAGINPPYILVGHSLGGPIIQVFTGAYPGEVGGLVMVDPSLKDFFDWVRTRFPEIAGRPRAESPDIPVSIRNEREVLDTSLAQAARATLRYDLPVRIVTGARRDSVRLPEVIDRWNLTHSRWTYGFSEAKHVLATESGHFVQEQSPHLVIKAISEVVEAARAFSIANKTDAPLANLFYELENRMMNAFKEGDKEILEQIIGDEFVLTSATSKGEQIRKRGYIDGGLNLVKVESFRFHDLKVQTFDNAAIVTCRIDWKSTWSGKRWDADFLMTDVWVKRDNKWQIVNRHSSYPAE